MGLQFLDCKCICFLYNPLIFILNKKFSHSIPNFNPLIFSYLLEKSRRQLAMFLMETLSGLFEATVETSADGKSNKSIEKLHFEYSSDDPLLEQLRALTLDPVKSEIDDGGDVQRDNSAYKKRRKKSRTAIQKFDQRTALLLDSDDDEEEAFVFLYRLNQKA